MYYVCVITTPLYIDIVSIINGYYAKKNKCEHDTVMWYWYVNKFYNRNRNKTCRMCDCQWKWCNVNGMKLKRKTQICKGNRNDKM